MSATANYIISAQDATKDAIRSIKENFKSLDQGIKSTAKSMNLALGFLAGAGLKSLFRSSLDATAEAAGKNSDFAKTLDDVKKSAQSLLVPKDGLPGVTDNLKELAATLKDPSVVSAADALFSAILRGGTAAVKVLAETAAGLRILVTNSGGNKSVDIDNKILALQDQMRGLDSDPRNSVARAARARIQQDINELQRKFDTSLRGNAGEGLQNVDGTKAIGDMLDSIEKMTKPLDDANQAAQDYEDALKGLANTASLTGEALDDLKSHSGDGLKEDADEIERQATAREYYLQAWTDMQKHAAEINQKIAESNERAAQDSKDAWTDVFLTGLNEGISGLERRWKDTLKMMVAQAAASGVLSWLKGGSFAGGFSSGIDTFTKGIGKLFGFADGGSFQVGGSGGTDSQLVAFKASPNERVSITKPGQNSGGMVFAPVYNIDARGATVDLVRALPGILERNSKATEARIVSGLRNGRYDT